MAKFVTQYKPSRKAKAFIKRIQTTWQSAFKNIIEVGKTLQKAKADLEKKEWLDMISHELPFTRRTAEKLIKIASDARITDPKNVSVLPPRWTTLHEITFLSDKQFGNALKKGIIHAEAERKDISALVTPKKPKKKPQKPNPPVGNPKLTSDQAVIPPSKMALMQHDQRRPVADEATDIVIAELATDREFTKKEAAALEKDLAAVCKEHGVTLKLSGNLKKQSLIKDLERQIDQKAADLKWDARDNDLTLITDAFYQFETGKNFPKGRNGKFKNNDLRNPSNEFHDFDKEQLYGYCQDLQLLTQYTPVDFLDRDAFVQILAWRFLTGNQLQKTEAYRTLQDFAEEEKKSNIFGKRRHKKNWQNRTLCRSTLKSLDE